MSNLAGLSWEAMLAVHCELIDKEQLLFVSIGGNGVPKIMRAAVSNKSFLAIVENNKAPLNLNIYYTVNEFGGGQGNIRTKENLSRLRAVFCDFDDPEQPIPHFPIPPSIIVETSPGKYQFSWLLEESQINVDEWEGVQQTLVNDYYGDANARDIARILRLAGTINHKPAYNGFVSKLLDHNGKIYSWAEIIGAFPPQAVKTASGAYKGQSDLDLAPTIELLMSNESIHGPGGQLMGWLASANMQDPNNLKALTKAIIIAGGADLNDPRIAHRINVAVPEYANWIADSRKKEREAKQEITAPEMLPQTTKSRYTRAIMPGGRMKVVIDWVLSTMIMPNENIALIVAEHLVSVYGGGHYHLKKNTTTRKRIMLAQTGTGKNTIVKCLSMLERELAKPAGGNLPRVLEVDKFRGANAFSLSVPHLNILEHRVRSFIVNEAGVAGTSTAGDVGNLEAYQLQVLGLKADEAYYPHEYSKRSKDAPEMKPAYNGVWVYLHESTEASYTALLKQNHAFESGDLARADLFFIDGYIHSTNEVPVGDVPADILDIFMTLANDFKGSGSILGSDDRECWKEIEYSQIENELIELQHKIVAERNVATRKNDSIKISVLSRKRERIMTTILIHATINAEMKDGSMERPVATQAHLDYAIARCAAIDETVLFHASGGGSLSDDVFRTLKAEFVEKFKKLIKGITGKAQMQKKGMHVGRYESTGAGVGELQWRVNNTTITHQIQNGAFKKIKNDIFRGNTLQARKAITEYLCEEGILVTVKKKTVGSSGVQELLWDKRQGWWLNAVYFGAPLLKLEK